MFKVKATVVGFDADEEKHPCHFRYQIGEEIIYDGERIIGRICPSIFRPLAERMSALQASGGRHKEGEIPGSYYPFFHSPFSVYDPSYKKYDGVGFRPTLERPEEGYKFVADETFFDRPPGDKFHGGIGSGKREVLTLVCGDRHTLMRMEVQAFDLSDKGDSLPYFRRMMSILHKVLPKPGITTDKILYEFTDEERDNIYPSLGQNMIWIMNGELELMEYLEIKDGKATVTKKGEEKLEKYKASLSAEEREALKM